MTDVETPKWKKESGVRRSKRRPTWLTIAFMFENALD